MRFKRGVALLIVTILLISMLFSCKNKEERFSAEDFIKSMEEKNYDFEVSDVESTFIPTKSKIMKIGKDNIHIYIYNSNKEMEEDFKKIKNGNKYDNGEYGVIVDWVDTPHIFKKGEIIVIYVGNNKEIIGSLKDIL